MNDELIKKIASKMRWTPASETEDVSAFIKRLITERIVRDIIREFLFQLEKQGYVIIKKTERENTFLV